MKNLKTFEQFNHSLGHFNNDFVAQQAEKLGMSREEYIAHYGSPEIGSGIEESASTDSDEE